MSLQTVVHSVFVEIGEIIRAARERQHPRMSQEALGQLVGVNKKTVSKWERGQQIPTRHFTALEDALGIRLTNRSATPPRPTELSQMTYDELLNQQMRITAELARRGDPDGDRGVGGEQSDDATWHVTRRADLNPGSGSPRGDAFSPHV